MNKKIMLAAVALAIGAALYQFAMPRAEAPESSSGSSGASRAGEEKAVKYICPMHPQIISDNPGKCPICGMDLVPAESGGYEHTHGDQQAEKESSGKPVISISGDALQKMGVRTEKVSASRFGGSLRATGVIMENERMRLDLFSQTEGRVSELKKGAPGDMVRKGELFYTIYSPELLALQNDYLAAIEAGYEDLADAARNRMKLLGVSSRTLNSIAKNSKALENVPFYVPADGVLSKLEIRKGHYLKAGDEIGHIQDLSTVWVEAHIPEKDMGAVRKGDAAKVIAQAGAAAELEAVVDYVYPAIAPETRTGKARLVLKNRDHLLKPAGYVTVIFSTGASERVSVPSSALLRGSGGEHVIVPLGGGRFQARAVESGIAAEGRTEIISGLAAGEEVVVNGQFLIDSESSLRESLSRLSSGGGHAGH